MQVSVDYFRQWLSKKIQDYLAAHPEVTVQELADRVGVSAPTISRWKTGQTNVAEEHHERLFAALGTSREELARDLGTESVVLPVVRARGAVRTRGALRSRAGPGAATRSTAMPAPGGRGFALRVAVPRRVFVILLEGLWAPDSAWLQQAVRAEHVKLAQLMGEEPLDPGRFRLGRAEGVLMTPQEPKGVVARTVLEGIQKAGRPDDLALVYLSTDLSRDEKSRLIVDLGGEGGPTLLADLADWVGDSARHAALILEARWPVGEPGLAAVQNPSWQAELRAMTRRGLHIVVAALPPEESELDDWSFFSTLMLEGIRTGEADLNRDGLITLNELCEYASEQIDPRNHQALQRIAAGQQASIVPAPRVVSEGSGQDVAVAFGCPEGVATSVFTPGPNA